MGGLLHHLGTYMLAHNTKNSNRTLRYDRTGREKSFYRVNRLVLAKIFAMLMLMHNLFAVANRLALV